MRRPCTRKGAPTKAAWDLAKIFYKLMNSDEISFYNTIEKRDVGT